MAMRKNEDTNAVLRSSKIGESAKNKMQKKPNKRTWFLVDFPADCF